MTGEQAVAYLHSYPRFAGEAGLERMRQLLAAMGDPQKRMPFVHLAGTNGKGSTAAMIASALTAAGYKTGLTISPYILDFYERIQIDGRMIPPDELAETVERLRPYAEWIDGLVEFELVTAAAFDYFARQSCDIVVAEVGLGGRLDATNVIPPPLAAIITSISLDHTDILGETIAEIAREKCGIVKHGSVVIAAPDQLPEALAVIRESCAENGCDLREPSLELLEVARTGLEGTHCTYKGGALFIPLAGRHQLQNALSALTACETVAACGFERLDAAAMARGIAAVRFPVRLERMGENPLILLDGAHNPGGAAALAAALAEAVSETGEKLTAILGMLEDKDSEGALALLAPCFAHILCVTPPSPRALAAEELARRAAHQGCPDARACESLTAALSMARTLAAAEQGAVVVCGSLYLAAQAREQLSAI